MQDYGVLFGVLIALLVGLATGKAWERYKLVEGRWIDRRRVRQSPHFILGLNYLVAGQVDLAIEELEKAARLDPGALELRLVLGNLYREKGQVGRAIQEHQSLLQRPRLNRIEHANVLLCLGPRLPPRRIRRPRGGGLLRSPEARSGRTRRRWSTWKNCRKISTSGRRRTSRASGSRRLPARPISRSRSDPRVPRERARPAGAQGQAGSTTPRGDSRRRSISIAASRRRTCTWATSSAQQGDLAGASRSGSARSTCRRTAPTSRSIGSNAPTRVSAPGSPLRRPVPPAHGSASPREWRGRDGAGAAPDGARPARAVARAAVRGARAQSARARDPSGDLGHALAARPAEARSSRATSRSRASRSSTSIRTSACAAATAAPSCSGSARTATSGTRSSRNASRRRPTPRRRFRPA